jgi:epothilone polyketide synthase D
MDKLAQKQAALERSFHEPIALVGMGCRFPGGAHSPKAFWQLLEERRDAVTSLEPRWSFLGMHTPDTPRWAGLLAQDELDHFDAEFFEISDREADNLDPQQRLVLTVAWEALEDAGILARSLKGTATGVFMGATTCEYERLFERVPRGERDPHLATGAMKSAISGRLSYWLDLQGPSMTLDTACSSSLVAVHQAVQSLRGRQCDLALAGGVNLILSAETMSALALTRSLSPDGRCRTFDAGANGFVRGEGCGVIVLKRLVDAQRDGDRIWAVIRGSAVNHDGRSTGLTAPNVLAQQRLLTNALSDAQVDAAHVDYVETHGTGTPLGDPIEFEALRAVLGLPRLAGTPCLLGAVKTNLGHLEAAAGIAGLIKTALALHYRKVPGNLNFGSLNPRIRIDGTALSVASTPTAWPSTGRPGVAGVSAFGFSGTNAHVVLAEAPVNIGAPAGLNKMLGMPLLLSGKEPDVIAEQANRLKQYWEQNAQLELEDIARSAAVTRTHFEERAAVVASDRSSALHALEQLSRSVVTTNVFRGRAQPRAEVAVVFSGCANGLAGVCRVMHEAFPPFRESFDATTRVLDLELSRSLHQTVIEPDNVALLQQQTYAQPALFAFQVALFRLCEAWGLKVGAVLGASAGELAAAHVSGALSLEDACRLIAARGRLAQSLKGRAVSTMLETSEEVRTPLDLLPCSSVNVNLDGLLRVSQTMRPLSSDVRWVSTVTGSKASGATLVSQPYWTEHVRGPARIMSAVRTVESEGISLFLELAPLAEVSALGPACLSERARSEALWLPVLRPASSPGAPEELDSGLVQDSITSALSALHVRGAAIDWTAFFGGLGGRKVELPTYPFRARRHWIASSARTVDQRSVPSERPSPASAVDVSWVYRREWVPLEEPELNGASSGCILFLGSFSSHRPALEAALCPMLRATFARTPSDTEAIAALASDDLRAVVFFANAARSAVSWDEADPIAAMAALTSAKYAQARVFWVTHDCWSVAGLKAAGPVGQAALWGLGLSCSMEHDGCWGGLIDIPLGPLNRSEAERLLEVIRWPARERRVSIRNGIAYVARLARLPIAPEAESPALRTDGAYLVTGGLGGLGLRIARWLADRGARHLVLIGRTPLTERRHWKYLAPSSRQATAAQTLRELELRGVTVQTAAFDVADESAWSDWISLYRDEQRPPIRGVVHAAGVLKACAAMELTQVEIARHMNPKLGGALALERALHDEPLDFFVMFSSASALVASPQLAAYAAANACLDALAERRRAAGQPTLSVAWGPFAEAGMLVDAAHETGRLFQVMEPMRPTEAFDLMGRLWNGPPCAAVLPIDWERWRTRYRGLLADRLFERFKVETSREATPTPESPANVEDSLARLFTELLGSPEKIDPDESLMTLGLDSLLAYDAQTSIEKLWKVDIPVPHLLKGASVRDVAELVHLGMRRAGEVPTPEWTVQPTMVEFPAKDGLTLYGHLSLPDGPGPYPAVVVHTGDQGGALDERGRYIQLFEHAPLLNAGFAVLTVDQRGTPGHGEEYRRAADLGGMDVNDVLAAAQYLSRLPEINASRIGFVGTSRGAYAGLLAVQRAPDVFRAAVLRMGFYEPLEYVRGEKELRPETSPLMDVFTNWEQAAEFMGAPQRHPLTHLAKVKTPLMVVHGEADRIVDVAQARRLEQAAKNIGVEVHLSVVPKMGHDLFELNSAWPSVWEEIRAFLTWRLSESMQEMNLPCMAGQRGNVNLELVSC